MAFSSILLGIFWRVKVYFSVIMKPSPGAFFLCARVFVCAGSCVGRCMCLCWCMCVLTHVESRGQSLVLFLRHDIPWLWREYVFLGTWGLLMSIGWLARESQESTCLGLLSPGSWAQATMRGFHLKPECQELNSPSHAHTANTLPTEPSPHTHTKRFSLMIYALSIKKISSPVPNSRSLKFFSYVFF